jgi:hypothetical protein
MNIYVPSESFDWPLAYDAENLFRDRVDAFMSKNSAASEFAARMRKETGTDFFEWVDHLSVGPDELAEFQKVGFIPIDPNVYYHPKAMLPRLVIDDAGSKQRTPTILAIRPESIVDFAAKNNLGGKIDGKFGCRFRQMTVSEQDGHRLIAVERLAHRGFVVRAPEPGFADLLMEVKELWRTRKRSFPQDADAAAHAFELQKRAIRLVGADVACELFFAEERHFWEARNRAGQIQKRRQDSLGLGWGNHDHHTFRSSREFFSDLMDFLLGFGFEKRERYYAGAEAGWGAQILEHHTTGITVFADVDLMPEETEIDFSKQPLPAAPRLRTVGLWCGLHGDSFLQAGMHHLEARFDFFVLRDQLTNDGIETMKPFSDFAFLKQAFTKGEQWAVSGARIDALLNKGLITSEQAELFRRDGAIGSHLENLQRKGGYKGFNQKSVSVIIEATDPRALQLSQHQGVINAV